MPSYATVYCFGFRVKVTIMVGGFGFGQLDCWSTCHDHDERPKLDSSQHLHIQLDVESLLTCSRQGAYSCGFSPYCRFRNTFFDAHRFCVRSLGKPFCAWPTHELRIYFLCAKSKVSRGYTTEALSHLRSYFTFLIGVCVSYFLG